MEERIKRVMADLLDLDTNLIDESTKMDRVHTWDSLNHIKLCCGLEQEFDISLSVSEIESMLSYPAIQQVIRRKVLPNPLS
jgi:acyl carrier protein